MSIRTDLRVTTLKYGDTEIPVGQPVSGTVNITENGIVDVSQYASANVNVSTGGGGSVDSGVVFLDYDGSVVESWSSDEVASKTELPANPTREGYTSKGWNWKLSSIKSYIEKYPDAKVFVGQMYAWSAGGNNTKFYITLKKVTGLTVNCKMVGNKDWGDGTTDTTTSHTYSDYGDYIIECDGTSIPSFVCGQTSSAGNYTCTKCEVGKNVTTIGNYAFQYCYALASINIPDGVTTIGNYAFHSCCALASINIPDGVTTIGNYAFQNCYALMSITIPDGLTSIGASAFYNCYSLTSITIPDSVTSIGGTDAFHSCYALTSITIPDSVTSIGAYAFYGCYSLTSITIPDSVTSIHTYAFHSCYSLTSITIPDSVTSIGTYAFQNCYSLTSITIPDSLTSIDNSAFHSCYSLTSITIPDSVTSIGTNVFAGCYGIIKYDFSAATAVPTLANINAFTNIKGIRKIVIPDALYDEWIAASNWSTYADYIYKASEVTD